MPLDVEQWMWCIFFGIGTLLWGQVLISIPSWVVPRLSTICFWTKRGRQRRIRKRRNTTVSTDETPAAPAMTLVDLEDAFPTTDSLHGKAPSFVANSLEYVKQAVENGTDDTIPSESIELEEVDDDEDEEDEEEPDELRQGQMLWIRGLSRLQTQLLLCAGKVCSYMVC